MVDTDSGSLVEQYAYDVFGDRQIFDATGTNLAGVSAFGNPYGYTSRRHDDETGLMYFRARYYHPNSGEFISQDPLEYVDGMSQYRGYFVLNKVDPNGKNVFHLRQIVKKMPQIGF